MKPFAFLGPPARPRWGIHPFFSGTREPHSAQGQRWKRQPSGFQRPPSIGPDIPQLPLPGFAERNTAPCGPPSRSCDLAQDLKHCRQVAIKVLRPELAAALGTERFVREIEIAASLTHPHILPLFDSGEAGASSTTSCPTERDVTAKLP